MTVCGALGFIAYCGRGGTLGLTVSHKVPRDNSVDQDLSVTFANSMWNSLTRIAYLELKNVGGAKRRRYRTIVYPSTVIGLASQWNAKVVDNFVIFRTMKT